MPKTPVNPRKAALDKISTRLALFVMQETYAPEGPARELIGQAIGKIDKAVALLVAADEKAAVAKPA